MQGFIDRVARRPDGGAQSEHDTDTEVWLPRIEESTLCIEPVAAGVRPLQITLNEKKQALIHERVMELLTVVQPRVFDKLPPGHLRTPSVSSMSDGNGNAKRGPGCASNWRLPGAQE